MAHINPVKFKASPSRRGKSAPCVTLALLLLFWHTHPVSASATNSTGVVTGRAKLVDIDEDGNRIEIEGRSLKDVVVFLEPMGHAVSIDIPDHTPVIKQHRARFDPNFLVIVQGQTVQFPNNDRILHNVFSYSNAKKFDLGLYKQGESREVTFPHPGVVETFCSIHSSMYAQIYITPNPYYAVTDEEGRYRIDSVPVGKYQLRTWNKRLPEGVESLEITEVNVNSRRPVVVDVELGGT